MGLSPLYTSKMALSDTVYDKYHQFEMEHFYNSSVFYSADYNHEFKVLCHGVTRKGDHSISQQVLQEDIKSNKVQLESHETTKSGVLQGN